MLQEFYSLPGDLAQTEDYLKISFKRKGLQKDKEKKLHFAVRRINEGRIFLGGKRLLLDLS
jgi:hypothetical protein